MSPQADSTRITSLLTNEQLARLERLRFQSNRRFTSRARGEHTARRTGSSNDFADYRDYTFGDDIRFVDWNIFARLRRAYVKLYHQEEQMHLVVLIDASASMNFEGKLERAKQLAAAFSLMGLLATERVSVHVFNEAGAGTRCTQPKRGRASLRELLAFIESIEPGAQAPVESGIQAMLNRHRGRGAAVVLSDFLTTGPLRRSLNSLFSAGLELYGIQVLGPSEIDPDLTGDARLVDSETGETLDVSSAADLIGLYLDYRVALETELEKACRQRGGMFLCVDSSEPLDRLLFDRMRRKGWVR